MASTVKVKIGGNQDGSSNGKIGFSVAKKKVDSSSSKQVADLKQKSLQNIVKSKPTSGSTKSTTKTTTKTTTTKTTTTRVKQKKVYTLAGQKFDPPEEREPLRIFYESLSIQKPTSEMAEFWMMEHGLLSPERSRKAYEKKQRKQKQIRQGTPTKTPPKPQIKPESSQRQQQQKQQQASRNGDVKAKKRVLESDDDDDFLLSPKRRRG